MVKKSTTPASIAKSTGILSGRKGSKPRRGVQSLSTYVNMEEGTKLSDLVGSTIFIVKMEPTHSDQYGDGFNLFYKETPNGKETLRAYSYGQVVIPMLAQLYTNTHEGKLISLDAPVRVEVYKAGRATLIR